MPTVLQSVMPTELASGVADAPMETGPSPIELAAQALRAHGTVCYWTDFLKVRRCMVSRHLPKPLLPQ